MGGARLFANLEFGFCRWWPLAFGRWLWALVAGRSILNLILSPLILKALPLLHGRDARACICWGRLGAWVCRVF